jgi:CO/xanthine dehydrogenase FAD-binding subunit
MPPINLGLAQSDEVIALDRLQLDRIEREGTRIKCGAMVTLTQLGRALDVAYVRKAVQAVGGPAVRASATVGGNLFAKTPYGDIGVLLLALDARVSLVGPEGNRRLALQDFYRLREAGPRCIVLDLSFELPDESRIVFRKMARKRLNSASIVTIAVYLEADRDRVSAVRIALGGVAPTPIRATAAEQFLEGKHLDPGVIEEASARGVSEARPENDAYASSWYRTRMIPVQLRRALTEFLTTR